MQADYFCLLGAEGLWMVCVCVCVRSVISPLLASDGRIRL